MYRSVNEIQQSIKTDFVSNSKLAELYQLDQSRTYDEQMSAVSLESLLIYIVAMAHHLLERLMDTFRGEVEERMTQQRLMTTQWYRQQCFGYRHGHSLSFNPTTYRFEYPTAPDTGAIVRYAAVRQVQENGLTKLQVLVSKEGKVALTSGELTAFSAYMAQVGAAGVHLDVQSGTPDELGITMQVIYNPIVIDSTGARLDGSDPLARRERHSRLAYWQPRSEWWIRLVLFSFIPENAILSAASGYSVSSVGPTLHPTISSLYASKIRDR